VGVGQKVHPLGLRIASSDWTSDGSPGRVLQARCETAKIRSFLKRSSTRGNLPDRDRACADQARSNPYARARHRHRQRRAKIEALKRALAPAGEATDPHRHSRGAQAELDATLVAENIALQLTAGCFRRAMKKAGRALKFGAKGCA